MEHSYFKDRISAYIDGELPPYEEKVVREHLIDCEECQQIKAELEKIDSMVEKHSGLNDDEYWKKSAQKIEKRLGLSDTVVEDIKPMIKSKYKGLGWKLATVAASLAVLTFIGLHEKDIFEDIDTSPMMQAPSQAMTPTIPDDKDEAIHEDVVLESEEHSEAGKAAPSEKKGRIEKRSIYDYAEQEDQEKPKIGIPSPTADEYTKPDAKKETLVDKGDSVTTVEGLLSKVAGTVTNTQGEVFVRGGRAGEVDYIVDGIPSGDQDSSAKRSKTSKISKLKGNDEPVEYFDISSPELAEDQKVEDLEASTTTVNVEMEPRETASDKTISVQGKQDQLKVDETANQTTVSKYDIETSPRTLTEEIALKEDSIVILEELIARRDSIKTAWEKLSSNKKKLRFNSAVEKFNSIDVVEKQLIQSYYDVAIVAKNRDEEEYNLAIDFLKNYAADSRSRFPVDARNYLKRLDIIDY